jgi:hypothetical protein
MPGAGQHRRQAPACLAGSGEERFFRRTGALLSADSRYLSQARRCQD